MKYFGTFSKRMKLKRLVFFFYISANYQGCSVFTLIVAPKSLWRPHRVCSYFYIGLRAHVIMNNSGEKKEKQNELPWCRNVAATASMIFLILVPFSLDSAGLTFLMMLCWWWCSHDQCLLNFGGIYCSP